MRREPSGPTLLPGAFALLLVVGMCAGLWGMRGDIWAWLEGLGSVAAPSQGPGTPPNGAPAPRTVERLVYEMDKLEQQQVPYCFGGGHGVTPARPTRPPSDQYCWEKGKDGKPHRVRGSRQAGLDCSSSVSLVLQQAGFDLKTMNTTRLVFWGEPERGKRVTMWVRPGGDDEIGHVHLEVDGRFWGTSSENHLHGPGWHGKRTNDGFTPRHPPGL